MSDSRMISIDELNKMIDDKIREYKNTAEECFQELDNPERGNELLAQVSVLQDLKIEINDPQSIVNVSQNIQQTVAVIEAKNIINDNQNSHEL